MKQIDPAADYQGVALRLAALIAGFGILIMLFAAPFAEVVAYPKLVIPGAIEQTVQNIVGNQELFLAAIFAYLVTFICDVLVA